MKINLKKIQQEGRLKDFMIGETSPIPDRYADLPTSIDGVFNEIVQYHNSDPAIDIWPEFEDALYKLTTEKEFIFLVPLYLFSFFRFNQKVKNVAIDLKKIKISLKRGLLEFNSYLLNNEDWVGKNMTGGLLAYINYMLALIKQEFNIDLEMVNES